MSGPVGGGGRKPLGGQARVNVGRAPVARGEKEKKEGVLIRSYNELKLRILLIFNALWGAPHATGLTSRTILLQPVCQRLNVEKLHVFNRSQIEVRCIVHRKR